MGPTVSVGIPTFNRPELLRQCILSVLAQTFLDFEVIVCDNSATPQTGDVVASIKDDRIRYYRNNTNLGYVGNFNRCLSLSRGSYVTVFHDDDLMLPENLRLKVRALEAHREVGFVHSRFN